MTKDDIFKMAEAATRTDKLLDVIDGEEIYALASRKEFIEKFATAIAAAERQAIIDELQKWHRTDKDRHNYWLFVINYIQGRGQQ